VPILMYHYIAVPPPRADAVRRDLSVSPENFAVQLRYLREGGYHSITLRDLVLHLQTGYPLPEKPVILTFDDGYIDAYTQAYPLLQQYGFTATFFLITGFIDSGNPEYVTWGQVREMSAAGMEMEAHSLSHPDLTGRSVDYLVWQIVGCKEAIEAHTGKTVRFFNYPSGRYDRQVIAVLTSADFWGAVTTESGITHSSQHLFQLKRIRVHAAESLATFVKNLTQQVDETEKQRSGY
jgi:peptidoglycan/xylan/chitin deacetylase (PgdA/CDA1 family)